MLAVSLVDIVSLGSMFEKLSYDRRLDIESEEWFSFTVCHIGISMTFTEEEFSL